MGCCGVTRVISHTSKTKEIPNRTMHRRQTSFALIRSYESVFRFAKDPLQETPEFGRAVHEAAEEAPRQYSDHYSIQSAINIEEEHQHSERRNRKPNTYRM